MTHLSFCWRLTCSRGQPSLQLLPLASCRPLSTHPTAELCRVLGVVAYGMLEAFLCKWRCVRSDSSTHLCGANKLFVREQENDGSRCTSWRVGTHHRPCWAERMLKVGHHTLLLLFFGALQALDVILQVLMSHGSTHARSHSPTPSRTHSCTYARTHSPAPSRAHSCMHARTHSPAPSHAHSCTHARTHTRSLTHLVSLLAMTRREDCVGTLFFSLFCGPFGLAT